ncbi:MAG TPA: 30S ribosomal protein S17 [Candidatus Aenigmarchaeota archaeon]|nr:30S ribosomal protein S17 [Candidatus Aenigmarchaeota archaeon]
MRSIGLEVKYPEEKCESRDCPFHGTLKIRGRIFDGIVVSLKPQNTVVIERHYLKFISKYERYERRKKRISIHRPSCMRLKKGDIVNVAECKPISKTKRHVIIEKLS